MFGDAHQSYHSTSSQNVIGCVLYTLWDGRHMFEGWIEQLELIIVCSLILAIKGEESWLKSHN